MSTSNQQTQAESGANKRPPMLDKGNYIPWECRFRRFLDNKLEDGERIWNSIQNGPYKRPMIPNPNNDQETILEPLSKMTEGNKKQNIADVKVMNYLLQAIPNDIYNSVDACKNTKDMWEQIKRFMFGSDVTSHVRHSPLINEFDKFTAKEGESLESVYERLTTLVNIMDRNNVRPIPVSINIKFLNCLQPELSKYVTMVHHNQTSDTVSYDVLYDSLVQFEPHVLASKANKAPKNHDPLALLNHSNASLSQSHANYSYSPQPYYVTHPSSVVDYEDKYQGELQRDSQEDKLIIAMMIVKLIYKPRMQVMVEMVTRMQGDKIGKENVLCYNCNEKGQYASDCQKPRVHDAKYFREQMLLAMKDEAGSNLKDEENAFLLDNSYGEETMKDEVNASSKVHEQVSHVKCKTVIQTSDDDQINSNIIFDDPCVENNSGTSDHDSNAHDEYHEIQMLAYNLAKKAFKERENRYLENIVDLREKLSYKNLERLKKVIAAQPKMYDGERLHSAKLQMDSPNSEETLKDAEERNVNIFESMEQKVDGRSLKENILQNEIDRLLEVSLTSEIRNCVLIYIEKQKNELLKAELEKSSSDSKDIRANLLKRIKILENDFKRSQAQSIDFELKLQHQKEKMACDVLWKSKLSTINDENVLC
ncbi:putative ribonuclease H-like domain-containing protein [Tanacetum coccineum]